MTADFVEQKKAEMRKSKRKQTLIALALISPFCIIFLLFKLIPTLLGGIFSFMQYNPNMSADNEFIGLQNYINIFNFDLPVSRSFWESFGTMLTFVVVTVPALIIIPLVLAYFINMHPPGYKIFRAIIYLPSVVSVTIVGIVFGNMFAGDSSGFINAILGTEIKWLSGLPWAGDTLRWFVMFIASIWWQSGTNFVIFSGALRNVPKSLYEACEMDGGGRFKRILYVMLPNIKSAISIVLFNTLIGYLGLYGQPTVLSEIDNESLLVSPMMFIQHYLSGGLAYARQTGYICACAIIFGLIVMGFGMIERRAMADRKRKNNLSSACNKYFSEKGSLQAADIFEEKKDVGINVGTASIAVKKCIFKGNPLKRIAKEKSYAARGKLTKSERIRRREKILSFCILLFVCIIWCIPLLYMVGTSFKSDLDLQLHPETLFPSSWSEWTLDHYSVFIIREGKIDNMPIWMLNSLWSTLMTVGLTVLIDLLMAYAVVFLKFKGKNVLMKFLMLWMAVPGVISTAPSFALYSSIRQSLNITGTMESYFYIYFWLIVPGVAGIFNMLLMRNFFDSIPKEIVESARSDGASNAKIFFRIVCPLAKSTIMLIVLFTFTSSWSSLEWPQLLFAGESSYFNTITVALTLYTGGSSWGATGVACATSVFALIPIIIIFIITQNKMIDGLASTGVKR